MAFLFIIILIIILHLVNLKHIFFVEIFLAGVVRLIIPPIASLIRLLLEIFLFHHFNLVLVLVKVLSLLHNLLSVGA